MTAGARLRSVVLTLVAALVLAGAPVLAASANPVLDRVNRPPVDGPTFNDPSAPPGPERSRIIRSVTRMIDSTPRGATLRLTQYNLTCASTVDALIRAIRRGVNVQIVINDKVLGESVVERPLYQRFGRLLGKNHNRDSFFIICQRGCRTARGGALHTKFLSIDRIKTDDGQVVRNVLLTASGNLTCGWAVDRQYNDQFAIIGRPAISGKFNRIFAQLAADRRPPQPFQVFERGRYKAWFFPNPGGDRSEDPIWRTLKSTRCTGVENAGRNGRTVVRVIMFTWNGLRGLNLARKLYQLDQAGCYVEVLVGAPGAQVLREIRRPGTNGGAAVWDTRKDRNLDGELDLYNHMKVLMINGRVGANPSAHQVLTGSANWTPDAFTSGDELLLRVQSRRFYQQYSEHFDFIRARSQRLPNISSPLDPIRPYSVTDMLPIEAYYE
jgi:phosphatidylserine/phosphatidylglycerophosphate/cardiolipin synthase-like enzyme